MPLGGEVRRRACSSFLGTCGYRKTENPRNVPGFAYFDKCGQVEDIGDKK